MIEMRNLLAQDKILQQRRGAEADTEGALVVRDRSTLVGGQSLRVGRGRLMGLSSVAGVWSGWPRGPLVPFNLSTFP